ncbi:glycosyltransferase family 1 protein [Bdellovibrio sp. HCB-162]|uniref:glycosyltransferase family 1 protein n=1 Tax=Bdellovibrio sp. HCB-162 TaxID=3394234 RepID=UPI0039BD6DDB
MKAICTDSDLVVFSHLRWDFVFQRPQHLMTRYALYRRVYFVEEPIFEKMESPYLDVRLTQDRLHVVVPHMPNHLSPREKDEVMRGLLDSLFEGENIQNYSFWYYTPMAINFSDHLQPAVTIYDCMDELSKFKGADPALIEKERLLLMRTDLVFTGGYSLYEAKKDRHMNVHPFPSAIDAAHFKTARETHDDPADQKHIKRPRLGFVGVIDERMDLELLQDMALLRPQWEFVLIGPVVKINPATLPREKNIHYLGKKNYQDLPRYLSNWDCALMPFAKNEATQFISPTKTPEYLAAGLPVVSTSIRDVVEPYGTNKLVEIADCAKDFVARVERVLATKKNAARIEKIDQFLKDISWDRTWRKMAEMEAHVLENKNSFNRSYDNLN